MTIATKKLTFEEYLNYDDGTNTCYELVQGFYDAVQFRDGERIISLTFPQLDLTAAQALAGTL
jgi:Uma2 family endonuclease